MNEPEYCECENGPFLPIGGERCETCGKLVEPTPPPLGVSVEEAVETKDKPG